MRQINIDAFMKLYKSVSNVYMPQSQHFEARHPNRDLQHIRVYTSTNKLLNATFLTPIMSFFVNRRVISKLEPCSR